MYEIKNNQELAELKHKRDVCCKLHLNEASLKLVMPMIQSDEVKVLDDAIKLMREAQGLINQVKFNYKVPNDLNKSIALYEAMNSMEMFNPHTKKDGKNYGRD